jgi:hypothetical protein
MGINYVICQRAPRGVGNNLAPSKRNINAPPKSNPLKITSMVAIEIQGCKTKAMYHKTVFLSLFNIYQLFTNVILLKETPGKIFERRFSL